MTEENKEAKEEPTAIISSNDWLGVESAPMDGTEILCFDCYGDRYLIQWVEKLGEWRDQDLQIDPIMWTHIPNIPNVLGSHAIQRRAKHTGED